MVSLQDCFRKISIIYLSQISDRGNGEHSSVGSALKTYNEIQDLRVFDGCDVHGGVLASKLVWHQPRSQQQPTTQSEI